jgi:hypothetical protein
MDYSSVASIRKVISRSLLFLRHFMVSICFLFKLLIGFLAKLTKEWSDRLLQHFKNIFTA